LKYVCGRCHQDPLSDLSNIKDAWQTAVNLAGTEYIVEYRNMEIVYFFPSVPTVEATQTYAERRPSSPAQACTSTICDDLSDWTSSSLTIKNLCPSAETS